MGTSQAFRPTLLDRGRALSARRSPCSTWRPRSASSPPLLRRCRPSRLRPHPFHHDQLLVCEGSSSYSFYSPSFFSSPHCSSHGATSRFRQWGHEHHAALLPRPTIRPTYHRHRRCLLRHRHHRRRLRRHLQLLRPYHPLHPSHHRRHHRRHTSRRQSNRWPGSQRSARQ